MEVKIRDLDPVIVKKIDVLASKKRMSRNEYLKHCLNRYAADDYVAAMDRPYTELVQTLSDQLTHYNDVIEVNCTIIRELLQEITL